nr:hypothetical protein [Lancefieldella rimae]
MHGVVALRRLVAPLDMLHAVHAVVSDLPVIRIVCHQVVVAVRIGKVHRRHQVVCSGPSRHTCLVRIVLEVAKRYFPFVGNCILELVDCDEVGLVLAAGPAVYVDLLIQGILFGR